MSKYNINIKYKLIYVTIVYKIKLKYIEIYNSIHYCVIIYVRLQ